MPLGQSLIIGNSAALMSAAVIFSVPEKVNASERSIVTLYTSSNIIKNYRGHIATFDADERLEYNWYNCINAANMFENQPGVIIKYWCEKGPYSKQ